MINSIHPGLILILFGIIIMVAPEKLRKVLMIAGPVIAAFAAWSLNQASSLCLEIVPKITLQLLHVDSLTKMFLVIFSAASLIGAVYALSSKNRFETGLEAI